MTATQTFQKDRRSVNVPLWREAFVGLDWMALHASPVYYGFEYVSMKDWWRIGAIVSLVNRQRVAYDRRLAIDHRSGRSLPSI